MSLKYCFIFEALKVASKWKQRVGFVKQLHNEASSRTGTVSTLCIHTLCRTAFSSKSRSILLSTFLFPRSEVLLSKVSVSTCVYIISHPITRVRPQLFTAYVC